MARDLPGDEVGRRSEIMRARIIVATLILAAAAIAIALLWTAPRLRRMVPYHGVALVGSLVITGVAWLLLDLLAQDMVRAAFDRLYRSFPRAERVLERRLGGPVLLLGVVSAMAALFVWLFFAFAEPGHRKYSV